MELIHNLEHFKYKDKKIVLCIGNFDGVHLGHQALIHRLLKKAKEHDALAMILTFDPHPSAFLRPEHQKKMITNLRHKLYLFQEFHIPVCFLLKFNQHIADLNYKEFIYEILVKDLKIHTIIIGHDFGFGKGRKGNADLLKEECKKLNIDVIILEPVLFKEKIISSTRIREHIYHAQFDKAEKLLGRPYSIFGQIVHGNHVGKGLGFPTANIKIENECIPPLGVYAVKIRLGSQFLKGIANIGTAPTFDKKELLLEVFIFDFKENIYEKEIEVIFVKKIRDERLFDDAEELKKQITIDCKECQEIFKKC